MPPPPPLKSCNPVHRPPLAWGQRPGLPLIGRNREQAEQRPASQNSAIFWVTGDETRVTLSEALAASEKVKGGDLEGGHTCCLTVRPADLG